MPFVKGQSGNASGRPQGAQNKATADARAAIASFVDGNVGRLNGWLDQVAQDNPVKAFELFQSVIEYHVPKLARHDNNTNLSGSVEVVGKVVYKGIDE